MKSTKATRFYLVAAVLILVAAALGSIGVYKFSLAPVSSDQATVNFDINTGDKATLVAKNLKQAGLIRDSSLFLFYLDLHDLRVKLQSGTYALKPSYSLPEIADILTSGKVQVNRLTITEGSTIAQIKQQVQAKGIKPEDFDAALNQDYGKDFLLGRPPGITLEGYLFPDSYEVGAGTTADKIVGAMVDNFDRRVTLDLRQAFTDQGLTLHQGITLASIVEKEVSKPEDRALVAGIFLRRIKAGQPLESDVTVNYAAAQLGQPFSTDLNSPYNTYRHAGLPPGPICNPGLDAITHAAHPTSSPYLYFVAGKDGVTHYAKTFAEHQQNVAKYLH